MNPLTEWLDMTMDWPFVCFHGKARDIPHSYATLMPEYLAALEQAQPEHREAFYQAIFETLYFAVDADDPGAIRRIYGCCPGLARNGYVDGYTPLGAAIESGRFEVIKALLECGFDPDANALGFGEDVITQIIQADEFREDILFLLLRSGAYLEPKAVAEMVSAGKDHLIPQAAALARDFNAQAVFDWIVRDDAYQKESYGPEAGLTEDQLERLRRLLG